MVTEQELSKKFGQVAAARDAYEEAVTNNEQAIIGLDGKHENIEAFEAAKAFFNATEKTREMRLIQYRHLVDRLLELWAEYRAREEVAHG